VPLAFIPLAVPVKLISRIAKLRAAGISAAAKRPRLGSREQKVQATVGERVGAPASVRCKPWICQKTVWGRLEKPTIC
jgi:hypothetical protein